MNNGKSIDEFLAAATMAHGGKDYPKFLTEVYLQACDYVHFYETSTPDWEKAQDLLSQNEHYEAYKHWQMVKQDFERSQLFNPPEQ